MSKMKKRENYRVLHTVQHDAHNEALRLGALKDESKEADRVLHRLEREYGEVTRRLRMLEIVVVENLDELGVFGTSHCSSRSFSHPAREGVRGRFRQFWLYWVLLIAWCVLLDASSCPCVEEQLAECRSRAPQVAASNLAALQGVNEGTRRSELEKLLESYVERRLARQRENIQSFSKLGPDLEGAI